MAMGGACHVCSAPRAKTAVETSRSILSALLLLNNPKKIAEYLQMGIISDAQYKYHTHFVNVYTVTVGIL